MPRVVIFDKPNATVKLKEKITHTGTINMDLIAG